MAETIVDLGEYGEILVESSSEVGLSTFDDDATEKTGFRDTLRQTGGKVKVEAAKLLKLPLTGLAKLFIASIPESSTNDLYEIDQFSIEFNLGIKTEAGTNVGAVAKIMPEGAFKCTYTWKRKPTPPASGSNTTRP